MWATIPDNLTNKFNDAVLAINSQVPAGYEVFVIALDASEKKGIQNADATRAKEAFEAAFARKKSMKFHPEYIETWHARLIPGQGVMIGNNPWDKHPAYSGPEDTKVFVYIPKLVDEKEAEARQREWAAKEKAKIDAKAAKDKAAVDGKPAAEGALAAGGPADPTLVPETAVAKKKKAPAAPKASAEVVATPKKKASAKSKKGA